MSPRRFSRELYPAVEVQLVEEGGTNLPGRLEHGHILFAIMAVDDERFDSRPLYPSYALAVVSNMHKFARRRTLDVAELADEPVICFGAGSRHASVTATASEDSAVSLIDWRTSAT